jgi:uncharacterized protein (TIGR02996 family)
MPVHIVYRCHYVGPAVLQHVRFDDDNLLDWFRRHWAHLTQPDPYDRLDELLGMDIYGFADIFNNALENKHPPPDNVEQLRDLFDAPYQEALVFDLHCAQVLTDDDDIMMAYYLFDGHFLAQHADRAAFLLQGFDMPAEAATEGFRPPAETNQLRPDGAGPGITYVTIEEARASDNLDMVDDAYRIEGVRLPDLARHLLCRAPKDNDEAGDEWFWPGKLFCLRDVLLAPVEGGDPAEEVFLAELRADPGDEATWRVYSDWLLDHGQPAAGITLLGRALLRLDREVAKRDADPAKSRVQAAEHVAQAGMHVRHTQYRWRACDEWHRIVLFDDLWAAAHPALATSALRHLRRWDVLSDPDTPSPDPE